VFPIIIFGSGPEGPELEVFLSQIQKAKDRHKELQREKTREVDINISNEENPHSDNRSAKVDEHNSNSN